jgi:prepilin-type N-terminal cleavage/methylation domain-containing protein
MGAWVVCCCLLFAQASTAEALPAEQALRALGQRRPRREPSSPRASRHGSRRAFTVVELLVVITIVSVLIAIVLPVLASARRKAHETTCVSNLHQLAAAWEMYRQDHDGGAPGDLPLLNVYVAGPAVFLCPLDGFEHGRAGQSMWLSSQISGTDPRLSVPFPYTYSYASLCGIPEWEPKLRRRLEDRPSSGVIGCVCHGAPWARYASTGPWHGFAGLVLRARPDGAVVRTHWDGTESLAPHYSNIIWPDLELGLVDLSEWSDNGPTGWEG